MKLSFILILVASLNVFANSFAQNINLSKDMRNTSIKEVLKTIEVQSGYRFFYSDDFNVLDKRITLKAQSSDVKSILEQVFVDTPASVEYMEGNIVIITPFAKQGITVTGTITDNSGPLPGVNVTVKGTTTGVVTDGNGKYTINVPNADAVLVFSFMGYATTEMPVGEQREISVELSEDTKQIEEVVVVGYGTQKKVNLTGAVAAVKVDEALSNRAVSNVSSGLQGLLPGLAVSENSGMAGKNDVSLMIRGMGTINNSAPLVVVDGMPDVDINRLNMSDIESVSILKDASSSAVYGSRAANGVILITTRTGKGAEKTSVNFTASHSWGVPTKSYEYMADYPRALEIHRLTSAVGVQESAQSFKKGTIDQWLALGMIDPVRYPNTDWWDVIMRTSKVQNYNLSATGSSDRANFFASIGIKDQKGLQINNDYTLYSTRFNFDYKVRNNMNVGIRFSGNWSKYTYYQEDGFTDSTPGSTAGYDLRHAIAGIYPYDPETGYYGGQMAYNEDNNAYNPYAAYMLNPNRQNRQEITPSIYLDWTPVKGLTARVEYFINYFNQFRYGAAIPMQAYNFQTETFIKWLTAENAGVNNYTDTGYKTQAQARLNYSTTIATNHTLDVTAVYSEEFWYKRSQNSTKLERLHPSLTELNATVSDIQTAAGTSETEGLRSVIGRINYAGFNKYLLEITFRADGSSRFYPGYQWGYFPSFSAGWRFTEENFLRPFTEGWLSQGKFRVSYGSLGNNSEVGRYEQREVLSANNYMINSKPVKGFVNKKMINQNLSWESTAVLNFGLDLGFLQNRLTAELDYYNKRTTGMIQKSDMSILLIGAYDAPRVNIGKMRNRGVEANITWRDRKGEFSYMVNLNASYNRTMLEKWNGFLDKGYTYVDMPYKYVYTYLDNGIAQTWQDGYNTGQNITPGDIVRTDVNGDGRIDGNDKVAYPDYQRDRPTTNFGLSANASWKGIDLSFMLTGAAGRKSFWLTNFNNVNPTATRWAFTWDHYYNPWSYENRGGEWPRMGGNGNREESSFWLDNMAYMRLKNIQLGYSLPKRWINVLFIDNFRVYCTAENIATLTNFRGLDPERGGVGDKGGDMNGAYPLVKSFSVGVNVSF